MIRTQIQLPDAVYARARRVADAHEMSFAELARRGIEQLLNAYPTEADPPRSWQLPVIGHSRLVAPLDQLKDLAVSEEGGRGRRDLHRLPPASPVAGPGFPARQPRPA